MSTESTVGASTQANLAQAEFCAAAEVKTVHRAVDNLLIASTRIQLAVAKAIESMSTAKRKILEYGH